MKYSRTLIVLQLFSFLLIPTISSAQKAPMKFGDVSKVDLQMTRYSLDSGASAIVLCDYGVARIQYASKEGWKLFTDVHRRIKIFNQDGYDWANAKIYLYGQFGNREKLKFLKGTTYNLVDGKIVKSKLTKASIFEEKLDETHIVQKFTMPNVKEGSVFEYSYTVESEYLFNFDDWAFQTTIPVVRSEFRTKIPNYFIYKVLTQGYLEFDVATLEMKPQTVTTASVGLAGVNTTTYPEENRVWVVKDAPAFIEEEYITSSDNYISKVNYELAYVEQPGTQTVDYMGSWEKFNQRYLDAEYFGEIMLKAWLINNPIKDLPLEIMNENEKVLAVYNFVRSNMTWNGQFGSKLKSTLEYSLRTPLKEGKGNVAEVNLILTTLLRKAGLEADPVLISTRSHGTVSKDYPMTDQFNYVICKVYLGDEELLLDATDAFLPMDLLPERCLNGQGWAISKNKPGWTNLTSGAKKSTRISGAIILNDEGSLTGNLKYDYAGYNARSLRQKYNESGEQNYINEKINTSLWEINKLQLENAQYLTKSFIENYDFEMDLDDSGSAATIYLSPMLDGKQESNPFKLEERKYPVDFGAPIEDMYYVTIKIPNGYALEQVPTPLALALPSKSGNYKFQVSQQGNTLTVYSKLSINKVQFSSAEYAYLKEFFSQIIKKQKEHIVLKKA